MIPILYEKTEKSFTTNGLGRLGECTRCIVTEELNGQFELEFDLPVTAKHYSEIEIHSLVSVIHDDGKLRQPFEVYRISKPMNGIVTFNAHHISYRLSETVLTPYTASTCAQALSLIPSHCQPSVPFTFWTDISVSGSFKVEEPTLCRKALGGEEGSILDVFGGGEYQWDKFQVKLYANRGSDRGVTIRYAKNLLDINDTTDDSGSYNAVAPYWADDATVFMLPEVLLYAPTFSVSEEVWTDHNDNDMTDHDGTVIKFGIAAIKAMPMDLSAEFDEKPTAAQLRAAAQAKFNSSRPWLPSRNIKVDFVALAQTTEYKNFAVLQRVYLGDTVTVIYTKLGTQAKLKVVRTVYNVLTERFDQIELGDLNKSYSQQILSKTEEKINRLPTKGYLDAAIEHATELISGGLGGHVVFTLNADGQPEEILIMDTDDVSTAVNVWRFNQGGLGHSHNGYNGPFSDIALTMDGRINASMITTGIINANLIQSGSINADLITSGSINADLITTGAINASLITTGSMSAARITSGTMSANRIRTGLIQAETGGSYWNLTTGELYLKGNMEIDSQNINVRVDTVSYSALLLSTGEVHSYTAPGFRVETDSGTAHDSYDANLYYKQSTYGFASLFNVKERYLVRASDADYAFSQTQNSRYFDTSIDHISNGDGTFETYYHVYRHGSGYEDRCYYDMRSYDESQLQAYIFRTSGSGFHFSEGKGLEDGGVIIEGQRGRLSQNLSSIIPGLSGTYNGSYFRVLIQDSPETPYNQVVLGVLRTKFAVTGKVDGTNYKMLVIDSNATCEITSSTAKINNKTVAYTSTSSRRYKEDIREIESPELDPHRLYDLPVRQFKYHRGMLLQYADMDGLTLPGFIAEEVEEIYPAAVIHDVENGRVESWDERRIIPGMLSLIQEQKKKIDELETRLEALVS